MKYLFLGILLVLVACSPVQRRSGGPSFPPKAANALEARAVAGREPLTTTRALAVVAYADSQVGKPYCWGGTGPSCFDCSGLAQTAWGLVGARLPRTTDEIPASLREVAIDDVRAGDVLWWPGHVGIYTGNGWMVDALSTRRGVVRRPAADPERAFRPASEPDGPPADWKRVVSNSMP